MICSINIFVPDRASDSLWFPVSAAQAILLGPGAAIPLWESPDAGAWFDVAQSARKPSRKPR
jgi:hypothetical protein